jgi:hypothetical protein
VLSGASALVAFWALGGAGEAPEARPRVRPAVRAPAAPSRIPDFVLPDVSSAPARETGFGTLVALRDEDPGAEPQTPDYSYNNTDPRSRAAGRYDPRELAVLQAIIDLNGLTESSSSSDFDDGNGVFEPLELGTQVWCGSHLRELYTGASEFASFGYEIRQLPASLGDLVHLSRLSLGANAIEELPASIAELEELRVLELYNNLLRELPEAMGRMTGLEVLQLRGNQLREIPEAVADLPNLQNLFLADNPLERMPERSIPNQGEARARRAVRRSVDCSPES